LIDEKNSVKPKTKMSLETNENTISKGAAGIEVNAKAVFPGIGEAVNNYDKNYGDLCVTSVQMPEVDDLKPMDKVTFVVECLVKEVRAKQDTKWNRETEQDVVTSDPYLKAECEILNITMQGKPAESEQAAETK
jgi:hypothetical protein